MSNTYRHKERGKNRAERRTSERGGIQHPSITNQEPPQWRPKHNSDFKIACHCFECVKVLRNSYGASELRRIRKGERRAIRVALASDPDCTDTKRRMLVPTLS